MNALQKLVLIIFFGGLSTVAHGEGRSPQSLLEHIREVRESPAGSQRNQLAEELPIIVRRLPRQEIRQVEIDALMGLLDDHEAYVRLWAASALGCTGGKGAAAIPRLERLKAEFLASEAAGFSSDPLPGAVDKAIERIVSDRGCS